VVVSRKFAGLLPKSLFAERGAKATAPAEGKVRVALSLK